MGRPRGACRACGSKRGWYNDPADGWCCNDCDVSDEHADQEGYWKPAAGLITEVYRKERNASIAPYAALRTACDVVLDEVPELDPYGLDLALEEWNTQSGQTDYTTQPHPAIQRIARDAWAAVAPKRRRPKRSARRKPARLQWRYAAVPLVILHDVDLSAHAKLVAAAIASTINTGRWNERLEATVTYDRLRRGRAGEVQVRGAVRARTSRDALPVH